MNGLRNLALVLLSFFLFLSLSVFGVAFMLNRTALNPNFITAELDKLDFSLLAEDLISEQAPAEGLPEEFETALINIITKLEPTVKEQAGAAIHSVYDYLLGRSQDLDLTLILRETILSADFVASLVDELDISSFIEDILNEQLTQDIPTEVQYLVVYLDEYLNDVVTELEPWLKQQIAAAADPILDYVLGESPTLAIAISLEPVLESLRDTVREPFLESPPPELAALPRSTLEEYFDDYFEEFTAMLPSTFELDESLLGTDVPTDIVETLATAEESLAKVKQGIGYFQLGYKLLIVFMVLLILGIVLIDRRIKSATRRLGITFATYGVLELIGIFIAKYFIDRAIPSPDIPLVLQTQIPQYTSSIVAPLQMFSIGLLIVGIALIVVSVVYKPRQPSPLS